jgi:hypothetical protein
MMRVANAVGMGRKTMKKFLSLLGLLGVLGVGGAAHAQLAGLLHVHSVPGVMETGAIGTMIACTNGGTSTATIGVEVYGSTGGAAIAQGSIPVASKATALFATGGVAGHVIDVNLASPVVSKGHARVVASTTRAIVCSPFLVDSNTGMPAAALAIMKKYTQK